MSHFSKKFLTISFSALLLIGCFVVWGDTAHAQVNVGLQEVGTTTGLSSTDIRVTIANIIRIVLGFLGVIALLIVLYGGFLWMTASGNEEKIATAKSVLTNGAIGLAIILASFAITSFILSRLLGATGGAGGTGGGGGSGGGGGGDGVGADAFVVRSFTPTGSVPIRNITVRVLLNRVIEPSTLNANFSITEAGSGNAVAGVVKADGSTVVFEPNEVCPAPNANRRCFAENTEYRVEVKTGLKSTDGKSLLCGGLAKECVAFFTSGSVVDTEAPKITLTYPDEGQSVSANSEILVSGDATDDAGVGVVDFLADNARFASDAPVNGNATAYIAQVDWNTDGLAPQTQHVLQATAFDVDSNASKSNEVKVIIRPEHCFNGIEDASEDGIDCGGTGAEACGACEGEQCKSNADCSGGSCQNGQCLNQPKILSVSPDNGAVGNYVTISGESFGNTAGTVVFLGDVNNPADNVTANLGACSTAWQNTSVVVEIPSNAKNGPLLVRTSNGREDRTNDARGPVLVDFLVNNIERPGICEVNPKQGPVDTDFEVKGRKFGNNKGGSRLLLDAIEPPNVLNWSDTSIRSRIPNVSVGKYSVTVTVGSEKSNPVPLNIVSGVGLNPFIANISPSAGGHGQYITLIGERFGSTGIVRFISKEDATKTVVADVQFPEQCKVNSWKEKIVVVKVPSAQNIALGDYVVEMESQLGFKSNRVDFKVAQGQPSPGICAVDPDNGPEGTRVNIYGEGFGPQKGEVMFWENKTTDAATTAWGSLIQTGVPTGAVTGPVGVIVASGTASNTVPFQVGACSANSCGTGRECCNDGSCRVAGACFEDIASKKYSWMFSTGELPIVPYVVEECGAGILPSPSPWGERSNGGFVCKNSAILARFNTPMDTNTISQDSFIVEECIGPEADADGDPLNPCAQTNAVFESAQRNIIHTSNAHAVMVNAGLKESTWYRVVVTRAIESAATASGERGASLLPVSRGMAELCGIAPSQAEGIGYCYKFKTSNFQCDVANVQVEPRTLTVTNTTPALYDAIPLADTGLCLALNPDTYSWVWSSADVAKATVTNADADQNGKFDSRQTVTPIEETVPGIPVQVRARANSIEGHADLTIAFADPVVVARFPDCDGALSCAEVGAIFNVSMSEPTLKGGAVKLMKCSEESCKGNLTEVSRDAQYSASRKEVIIGLNGALQVGSFYRVIISGNVTSTTGKKLTGLNYGNAYSWKFRVSESADSCKLDRVEISPKRSILKYIGQTQEIRALGYGAPDDCSPEGQRISLLDANGKDVYTWEWDATTAKDTTKIAGVNAATVSALDANPAPNPFCTNQCLRAGTPVGISVCGNGAKEKGEDCDDGNAFTGDGCSSSCLFEGTTLKGAGLPGAHCGNLTVDKGEDCDDGGLENGDGCSKTCLHEGSSLAYNSQCGNSVPQKGEDCDDGNNVSGDGCNALCLREGSSLVYNSQCGNKVQQKGEDCDDGNVTAGDGCSAQCLNEGTNPGTGAACGNGVVLQGVEGCDDGNTVSGDGCSSQCLNEGTKSATEAASCKNAFLESGEDCDYGSGGLNVNAGCSDQCLNVGARNNQPCGNLGTENLCKNTSYCSWTATKTCVYSGICEKLKESDCLQKTTICRWGNNACSKSICGDTQVDFGEDCDDGNTAKGDGCNDKCLFEGSSYALGSVCGDSAQGKGEECESGGFDKKIDARQYATAKNAGLAVVSAKSDTGVECKGDECGEVRVYCQYVDDTACSVVAVSEGRDPKSLAHGSGNCCYMRPVVTSTIPAKGESNVCRNGLMEVTFDRLMDPVSITANMELWQDNGSTPCGQTKISFWLKTKNFFQNIFAKVDLAQNTTSIWCPVAGQPFDYTSKVGEVEMTKVRFMQSTLLLPNTDYQLVIRGDNTTTKEVVEGVRSLEGQVGLVNDDSITIHYEDASGKAQDFKSYAYRLNFKTKAITAPNEGVCVLESVAVDPAKHTFVRLGQEQKFALRGNTAEAGKYITPITGVYDWEYSSTIKDDTLVEITTPKNVDTQKVTASPVTVKAKNKNGQTQLVSTAKIKKDILFDPTTEGDEVEGLAVLDNVLCTNLWSRSTPAGNIWSIDQAPFNVTDYAKKLNLGFWYCRDAGTSDTKDDLPDLLPVKASTSGTLPQAFLTTANATDKSAIGLRVFPNPEHLSLRAWYRAQDFKGNPVAIAPVGGYEALRDGNTTYVAFGNDTISTIGGVTSHMLYTNVLVVSLSEGASDAVTNIYNQVVSNLRFNTNFDIYTTNEESVKTRFRNDVKRFADLTDMAAALERHNEARGEYPQLVAGTFLRGLTVSTWPSWNAVLGTALGGGLPVDPKNSFATGAGERCAQASFDTATCFDSSKGFYCPTGSYLYWYNARGDGLYTLAAQFEWGKTIGVWGTGIPTKYAGKMRIALETQPGVGLCAMTGPSQSLKGVCGDGFKDTIEACDGVEVLPCLGLQGKIGERRAECNAQCSGFTKPVDQFACIVINTCGNGVLDFGEKCDDGTRNGQYGYCNATCSGKGPYCGDSIKNGPEVCDAGGKNLYSVQESASCRWDCQSFGPNCGDGVVQGEYGEVCEKGQERNITGTCSLTTPNAQGIRYEQVQKQVCSNDCRQWQNSGTCKVAGQCGNGIQEGGEECDDANSNTEDGCSACKLTYCGDGLIQQPNGKEKLVETCDLANKNGTNCRDTLAYHKNVSDVEECIYCSTSCNAVTVKGPHCGDGIVDWGLAFGAAGESCDGTSFIPNYTCETEGYDFGTLKCTTDCKIASPGDCKYCGELSGDKRVIGKVISAVTGEGVGGAKVWVARKKNDKNHSTTTTTDGDLLAKGSFVISNISTDGVCSDVTLWVELSGYQPYEVKLDGQGGRPSFGASDSIEFVNGRAGEIILIPQLAEDEIQIVLTWGSKPADMDLHLSVPTSPSHVYHAWCNVQDGPTHACLDSNKAPFAQLDVDDRNGFGPETITARIAYDGVYKIFVHNFDQEKEWSDNSNARVKIFNKDGILRELEHARFYDACVADDTPTVCESREGEGNYWNVGTFKDENKNMKIESWEFDVYNTISKSPFPPQ